MSFNYSHICYSITISNDYWKESKLYYSKPMNIKEKFLMSIKAEPEKSFRKAEITNGDDMLTSEGQAVFLAWLLQKHGAEFKKDVVDDILKEEEKK